MLAWSDAETLRAGSQPALVCPPGSRWATQAPLLSRPLTGHPWPVSQRIVHPQGFIAVGCFPPTAVELGTGREHARRQRCGDPSEEYQHTAEHDQPDEHDKADDEYAVFQSHPTATRTIRAERDPANGGG
jgi:hypothetical protein